MNRASSDCKVGKMRKKESWMAVAGLGWGSMAGSRGGMIYRADRSSWLRVLRCRRNVHFLIFTFSPAFIAV